MESVSRLNGVKTRSRRSVVQRRRPRRRRLRSLRRMNLGASRSVAALPKVLDDELAAALSDLREASAEAREEGFPVPSDTALGNAERLLRRMHRISPRRFEVYPTPDGEIAIDAPGGYNRSVLLLCDSEGGTLCLVNMNGDHRRARYSTSDRLPDGFIQEALADLEYEVEQVR